MKKIEIKSIHGDVLFIYESENATIKDAVEEAVKQKISLVNADLRYADLRYADLYSADLSYANLYSADLRSADLSYADLNSADLSYADLYSANLRSADLYSANLYSADLRSADLLSADLRLADSSYADLPIFCKWDYSIKDNLIKIGCQEKTIEYWDLFFASDDVYETERNTEDFKKIQAVYEACKAYLTFLNK